MSEVERSHRTSMGRVVVNDAAVPFVARGGRVFSGQVVKYDPGLEDGEVVQVVDRKNNVLSIAEYYTAP
ncbi:MAG: pseudouridine synthase [Methanothrix sp.]|nr:pseudouridine synthase [Methanothrix sp.]